MTDEQILNNPQVADFLANFARYCGAPKSVFEGQFLVAVRAVLDEAEPPTTVTFIGGFMDGEVLEIKNPPHTWELWPTSEDQQQKRWAAMKSSQDKDSETYSLDHPAPSRTYRLLTEMMPLDCAEATALPMPPLPDSLWGKEVRLTELDEAAELGPIVLLMPPPQSPTEP